MLHIGDVKINPKKIDLEILKQKASKLVSTFTDFSVDYQGYSLENM